MMTEKDTKAEIQHALDAAGIDYAKSWNKGQLLDAWNVANPAPASNGNGSDDDGLVHMSFGPTGTGFMTAAGYDAERVTDAGRGWFTIDPEKAAALVAGIDAEIVTLNESDENGSKAVARNLSRMRDRITDRLSKLEG